VDVLGSERHAHSLDRSTCINWISVEQIGLMSVTRKTPQRNGGYLRGRPSYLTARSHELSADYLHELGQSRADR
jgi:hypothetical protein